VHGSRRNRALATAAAALVIAGLATAELLKAQPSQEGGRGHAVEAVVAPRPAPKPAAAATRPTPTPAVPAPTLIATLKAALAYRQLPGGPVAGTLPATNPFGAPEVLAVVGGPSASGWAQVELPIRPNGSRGWIPVADVTMSATSYQVVVNVAADTVTVTDAGRLVLTTAAAVGKPSTPTPTGHTYLWELIRPDDPNGAYGPYIFGLGWFSNAYAVFNGGDAQIGIHGQDEPSSVGHPVSHGCVRVENPVISQLAGMLPLGTPVTIV
jgi:lipoprotein-anchoring transpeptidase ErfK/SrfK